MVVMVMHSPTPLHLATGWVRAHDGTRMRRAEIVGLEGDVLTLRGVNGEQWTRTVWAVAFDDRGKGRRLRKAVRESVPRGEWTGCGKRH